MSSNTSDEENLRRRREISALGLSRKLAILLVNQKVRWVAIGLMVSGFLGLMGTSANIVLAVKGASVVFDPKASVFVQDFQRGQRKKFVVITQAAFVIVNLIIIYGGWQMLQFRSRRLVICASLLSIGNFGACCCVLGIPLGLLSLSVLKSAEVINAFRENKAYELALVSSKEGNTSRVPDTPADLPDDDPI